MEQCDAVEAELVSTHTQEAENFAACEGLMHQVEELEEANRSNENMKVENISELERVEADATALRSSHAARRTTGRCQGGGHQIGR